MTSKVRSDRLVSVAKKRGGSEHVFVEYYLGGKKQPPILKEEFWRDAAGKVSRYSLAYIDPSLCAVDSGRVLGYDNAHGKHHRHFMGEETEYRFSSFKELQRLFEREVRELRRKDGV